MAAATRMTGAGGRSDPDLELVESVLVDGDNLLHAARGSRDGGGVAWLLPRLAAWRPPGVHVVVALDGHSGSGVGDRRPVAPGISVRHAGSRSADDLLVGMLEARPYAERARTVVVTDDGRLRDRVRRAGGVGRRVEWLMSRLVGLASSTRAGDAVSGPASGAAIGRGPAPTRPSATARPDAGERAVGPWRPGRGATRKSGNPRRSPRGGRSRRPPTVR